MSAAQLDLFADAGVERPVFAEAVCRGCGTTCRVPVEGGPSAPWGEAVQFGYIAVKAHEREGCPGDTPMARAARRRLLSLWPTHEHVAPGTVRYADLVTSTWDARAALMLALGRELVEGHA
ncbi:hypothetical protein [Blastococcus xanthinilyticus]|uniref:Uncharacterized protein n=1 Tax=Blastococcus xanthinilyticus TaxID=1564164 RepID=A0A5S5CLH4_9ACTN|nr:hypothetical protein [Blastococcus xanthinilyticus]TYP82037.1 hypothetical protein BD833_12021 [Blastococcus xanthinilyticus]